MKSVKFLCAAAVLLVAVVKLPAAPAEIVLNKSLRFGICKNFEGRWASQTFEATLTRNADNLQLHFVAGFGADGIQYDSAAKDDTIQIFSGEVIEVFLAPDFAGGNYFQIAVNPANRSYTAFKRDASWRPGAGFRSRTKVFKDRWELELTIPYSVFKTSYPADGSVWRANFSRNYVRASGKLERMLWNFSNSYHDVRTMGNIRFGRGEKFTLLRTGSDNGRSWFTGRNGAKEIAAKVEVSEYGSVVHRSTLSDQRAGGEFRIEFTPNNKQVPLKSAVNRRIQIWDARNRKIFDDNGDVIQYAGTMLQLNSYTVTPAYPVLEVTTDCEKPYVFTITDADGKVVFKRAQSGKQLKIAAGSFPAGRYIARLQSGETFMERVFFAAPVPSPVIPVSGKSVYGIAGETFTVDGKPAYLWGGTGTQKTFFRYGKVFTLMTGCTEFFPGSLRLEHVPGKRLVRQPVTGYLYPAPEKHRQILAEHRRRAIGDKPVLRRIAYEAQLPSIFPDPQGGYKIVSSSEVCDGVYRALRSKDYPHFLSVQIDRQAVLPEFYKHCDVLEISCHGSYLVNPLPQIVPYLKEVRQLVSGKPVIHWFGVTIPDRYCRIAEEVRAELFLGIMYGGAGAILHLGHGFLPESNSRLWDYLSTGRRELEELFAICRTGTALPVAEPENCSVVVRKNGDELILIAVNLRPLSRQITFDIPGVGKKSFYFTGWEPRIIRLSAGQ